MAYLSLLVAATVCALVDVSAGPVNIGLASAAVVLLAALLLRRVLAGGWAWQKQEPLQGRWLAARGAAEAVRSSEWRYAMSSTPFDDALTADAVWHSFARSAISRLSRSDRDHDWDCSLQPWMRDLRRKPSTERLAAYVGGRIDDQLAYFESKAALYRRRAREFRIAAGAAEVTAIVFTVVQTFGVLKVDIVGVLAAVLATIEALTQLRREESTADRYAEAHESLARLRPSKPGAVDLDSLLLEVETVLLSEQQAWYENIRISS